MFFVGNSETIVYCVWQCYSFALLPYYILQDILLEQEGTVELLSKLVLNSDEEVKLNGVWALMNITYKANPELRSKILSHVSVHYQYEGVSEVLLLTVHKIQHLLVPLSGHRGRDFQEHIFPNFGNH